MKLIWQYDACGEYADYKGYTIIKQDHPCLLRYEVTKEEGKEKELIHVGVCNTLGEVKKMIKELTK